MTTMKLIDPMAMRVTDISIDLNDYREIQGALGNKRFEEARLTPKVRIYVDAEAKLYTDRPARFLTIAGNTLMEWYGQALLVLNKGQPLPEIVFPKDRRVTALDKDCHHLGCFITTKAAAMQKSGIGKPKLNFQAILSDARFVAATRVVLATFQDDIVNAFFSGGMVPCLELEIERGKVGKAMDLYDELLTHFGYTDDDEEEEEQAPVYPMSVSDGNRRHATIKGIRA